jgi:hypothetical protein
MHMFSLPGSTRLKLKLSIDFIFAKMGKNAVGVNIKAVGNFHFERPRFATILQKSEKNLIPRQILETDAT